MLDQTGMSGWGWSQCSPVTVDNVTKAVTYEGSYWATKHYSYYIHKGATMVTTTGDIGKCDIALLSVFKMVPKHQRFKMWVLHKGAGFKTSLESRMKQIKHILFIWWICQASARA